LHIQVSPHKIFRIIQGSNHGNKFEQLGTILPTPNIYRTASGAPGHAYWQNRADYNITAYLDEDKRNLKGSETVTYYNNSPMNWIISGFN
jgi:hypothetical protein